MEALNARMVSVSGTLGPDPGRTRRNRIHVSMRKEQAFRQDKTRQDRTGQDRAGQDRTGQDRTGQKKTHETK